MANQIIDRYWTDRSGSGRIEEQVPFKTVEIAPLTAITFPRTNVFLPTLVDLRPFVDVAVPIVTRQPFVPSPLLQAPNSPHIQNFNAIANEQNRLQSFLGNIPVIGPTIEKGVEMAREVLDLVKGGISEFFGGNGNGASTPLTETVPIPGGVGAEFDRSGAIAGIPRGGLALILPGVVALAARTGIAQSRLVRMIVVALGIMTIEEAADHFGLSISEIARAFIHGKTRRRRRGRGISAADLRRTRSTLGKVSRINCLIKKGSRPTRCC